MNSHAEQTILLSAQLSIDPAAGQVQAGAECIRLGPVNMKVLMLLLESGNRVVTRNEFFERVWKQQLVSDDVLTRSISDLRTSLGAHTDVPVLIETIPKRGYRWVPPVETGAAAPLRIAPPPPPPLPLEHQSAKPERTRIGIRVLQWAVVTLAGFVLLSSVVLWLSRNYLASERIKLALLPIQADAPAQQQLAMELESLLRDQILDLEQFEILAFSATSLHRQNPFPVLAREYGVDYVVEARIQAWQLQPRLTLNVVDARSASVVDSVSAEIGETSDLRALSKGLALEFSARLAPL